MRLEIESAANFLSNLLRLHANLLSVDQLEVFRESIFKLLTTHYQQHWFPENPFKGSGYRCLRINHKMDPIIAKAGSNCGLDESKLRGYLPNELTLWIDPREVSYRIGENGSICVLFDAESSSDTKSDDEGSTSSTSSSSSLSPASSWHKLPQSPKSQSSVQNCRMNTSSPSGSSVSSTASTLSSPSPSSSPDWSLSDRKSPISAYSGYQHYSPQQNQYHHQTQQQYHHHPQQYQQPNHHHHHHQQQQQLITGSPNNNSNNNHHHSSTTNHHQQQQQQQQHHHHSGNVNTANNSGSNSNKDWNNYLHLQNAISWEALLHTGRSMYREQPNPVSVMTGPSWWRR